MGTGVGEAMLIGAAVGATAGGAGAAIQGGDPLKGALTGGAMGAVGGGLGAGFGAGAGAASGATSGTAAGSTTALVPGAMAGAEGAGMGATIGTAGNVGAGVSGVGAGSGTLGSAGFGSMSAAPTSGVGMYSSAAPGIAAPVGSTAGMPATIGGYQGSALPAGYGSTAGTTAGTNVFGYAPGEAGYLSNTQLGITGAGAGLAGAMQAERAGLGTPPDEEYDGPLSKLKYDPNKFTASTPQYAPTSVYRPTYAAEGGIMQAYRGGNVNAVADYDDEPGTDSFRRGGIARYDVGGMTLTGVPSGINTGGYQGTPESLAPRGLEALMGVKKKKDSTKEMMDSAKLQGLTPRAYLDVYGEGLKAQQQMASGGISSLGSYSDGGRMLKGPGDGMSDNIPATIAGKQPARLADGEFVVPADVVSHLGNGSTDAGAKQLYSMMDRVRKARTGNKKQGKQIKPAKYMVA